MSVTHLCAACGGPMSEARASLGLVTCSGPCNARRRRETGLVDGWEVEQVAYCTSTFVCSAVAHRPDCPKVDPGVFYVEEGRTTEWRRGFTSGLFFGLVLGLVLPLVTLLGGDAHAAPAEPWDIDYAAASASHEDCVRVLDVVGPHLVDVTVQAAALGRLLDEANARAEKAEARAERQAETIARLRDRLASR